VNKWWITDEVRYGWKHVHSDQRITVPAVKGEDPYDPTEAPLAYESAYAKVNERLSTAKKPAVMISPMLSCEDAYLLASYVLGAKPQAVLVVGPVPVHGENKTFPGGFSLYAEKVPNARGVRRVLNKLSANVMEFDAFIAALRKDASIDAVLLTGNYPSDWVTKDLLAAIDSHKGRFVALIDTLHTALCDRADVVIPGATWMEKAGVFENANNRLQAFERAIEPIDYCKSESQIALDLTAANAGEQAVAFNASAVRVRMAKEHGLVEFTSQVHLPPAEADVESDMQLVPL
jgi:NADH-quinone oxidoreductase subunit G